MIKCTISSLRRVPLSPSVSCLLNSKYNYIADKIYVAYRTLDKYVDRLGVHYTDFAKMF